MQFPDPRNRTPNEPIEIVTPGIAVTLYNECNESDNYKTRVDDDVINFIAKTARETGWTDVTVYGRTFLLVANVRLVAVKPT